MFNLTPTVRNLLIANVIVFLAQINLPFNLTQFGSLYPLGSPYFQPWQFGTYMFLHDPNDWLHIIFNMFILVSIGPLLEQHWGGQRFLTYWLICGIGAGILYEGVRFYEINKMEQARQEYHRYPSGGAFREFFDNYLPEASGYKSVATEFQRNPQSQELITSTTRTIDAIVSQTRDSPGSGMLGASGALFGVLFAFAYLFPNNKLVVFPLPVPIAAKYLVFGLIVIELYKGVHRTPGDNVAHFAHLGGLLIGFVILKVWERGRGQFY